MTTNDLASQDSNSVQVGLPPLAFDGTGQSFGPQERVHPTLALHIYASRVLKLLSG